jgi:hypothetical protein
MDIQDKFEQFQTGAQDLVRKPQSVAIELSTLQGKLSRLKAGRSARLAQDETEKADVLLGEIQKLEPQIEILEAKQAAFGNGGKESVQNLVAAAPGSPLYDLAVDIVAEAAETAPGLEKELQYFIKWGAKEETQKYLEKIQDFSTKLHELWEIAYAGLTAQKYLPEDLRSCKKPRLVSPGQGHFEIDDTAIAEVYRPLSRINLPD